MEDIKKIIVDGAREENLYDALTDNYLNLSKEDLLRIALEVIYNRYLLQREEFVTEEDKQRYNDDLADSLDEIL